MKKSILLFMAGVLTAAANGQQAQRSILFSHSNPNEQAAMPFSGTNRVQAAPQLSATSAAGPSGAQSAAHRTNRTTLGGGRWYNYSGLYEYYLDSMNSVTVAGDSIAFTGLTLWGDTTSIEGYTGGGSYYSYNPFVSSALSFDPQMDDWNNPHLVGTSVIAVTPADAYTIDSVHIQGWYNRNVSTLYKRTLVDTLIIAFVQGIPVASTTGGTADMPQVWFDDGTAYGLPSGVNMYFAEVGHDSINNRAGHSLTTGQTTASALTAANAVYKIPLTVADTNGANSNLNTTYPRAGHSDPIISYPVMAGKIAAMSVSFKSGDTGYHSYHAMTVGVGATAIGDTVRQSNGTAITGYKYGCFEQEFFFAATADGSTPTYGPYLVYSDNDWTMGYFKREGPGSLRDGSWGGVYEPFLSFTAASTLQYPLIDYHIQCPTCIMVGNPTEGVSNVVLENTVTAYPNPAGNQINVSYTLVGSSAVSVTLTNMLGQVVASQKIYDATSGKAVFSTSALPSGVYIYSLDANGERSTGRVEIAH